MTKLRTHVAPGYMTDDLVQTGGTPTDVSADGTLAGNSDALVPTQKAVKTYVDGKVVNETHGGTNQTAYAKGDFLVASGTNTLGKLSAGADGFLPAADSNAANGIAWYDSPARPAVKSGRYVTTPVFAAISTKTLATNTVYFSPFYVKKRTAFTDFGFATVAVTGAHYKAGVYADNGGAPTGTPVANSTLTLGPFTTTVATAQSAAFSSAVTLNPGWYWLAVLTDTSGSLNAATSGLVNLTGAPDLTSASGPLISFSQSYASGLPDMTSNTVSYAEGSASVYMGLKVQ